MFEIPTCCANASPASVPLPCWMPDGHLQFENEGQSEGAEGSRLICFPHLCLSCKCVREGGGSASLGLGTPRSAGRSCSEGRSPARAETAGTRHLPLQHLLL